MAILEPVVGLPCAASHSDFFETNIASRTNVVMTVKQKIMAPIWQMSHEPSCSRPIMNVGMEISAPMMKTINAANLRFLSG